MVTRAPVPRGRTGAGHPQERARSEIAAVVASAPTHKAHAPALLPGVPAVQRAQATARCNSASLSLLTPQAGPRLAAVRDGPNAQAPPIAALPRLAAR